MAYDVPSRYQGGQDSAQDLQRAFSRRMAECLMDNLVDLRLTRENGRREDRQTQRMLLG